MLDKLPVWARYFVATTIVPAVLYIITEVMGAVIADGAAFVDWGTTVPSVLNEASKLVAYGFLGYATFYLTPITRKFGLGQKPEPEVSAEV